MRPVAVIYLYGLVDEFLHLIEAPALAVKQPSVLYGVVEPFGHGVVQRVSRLCHAYPRFLTEKDVHVSVRAVLDTTVGVMYETVRCYPTALIKIEGLSECGKRAGSLKRRVQFVADDHARGGIHQQ